MITKLCDIFNLMVTLKLKSEMDCDLLVQAKAMIRLKCKSN